MIFKDIPGYEGLYQVSDCGQIKSLAGSKPRSMRKEKILKPGLTSSGYESVVLCKDKVHKTHLVHRLVMYAHSHVDNELVINHIDENKLNNHISNLEYCTHGENTRKYNNNNPEKAVERGKKNGKKNGYKYLDNHTGIIYASMTEVSFMMYETGEAKSKGTWFNILQSSKPQDRFVRVYNESK